MTRRTKIVATIGPASGSPEMIGRLIDAGMNVARLNLSHGKIEDHLRQAEIIRIEATERNCPVAILADLPGPKIRTTDMGDGILLTEDAVIELRSGSQPCTPERLFTDYPTVARDLEPGDALLLGDGGIELRVTSVNGDCVQVVVVSGGYLRARPGLHLPSERVSVPVPTDEDRELIKHCVNADMDFVAVSFVRHAEEIRTVRALLGEYGPRIVAKIETPTAIDNLEEIVEESDAVMVARGDLGTECPLEDVPVYQKRIIRTCIAHAVPVITATQMLESMITATRPTRAEASDVANAVCDGTDAIMLSGETAVGCNPVLVVETMARIANQAEIVADHGRFARTLGPERRIADITAALTHAALQAAMDAGVQAILCCTRSGATAHAMATLRPDAKLIALSSSPITVRQQALTWGVIPLIAPVPTDSDSQVRDSVQVALDAGHIRPGDIVAVLAGTTPDRPGSTDMLRLVHVGRP